MRRTDTPNCSITLTALHCALPVLQTPIVALMIPILISWCVRTAAALHHYWQQALHDAASIGLAAARVIACMRAALRSQPAQCWQHACTAAHAHAHAAGATPPQRPLHACRGRRCNVSPKLLLLPLSYASIFGGTTTLIGTSTNLVISGLQSQRYKGTPDAEFNFFDITPYGLP